MRNLFLLLYRYRAFLLFAFLQSLSAWMIIQNNNYQGAAYFNSANQFVASILNLSNNFSNYLSLQEVNQELAQENALLRKQIRKQRVQFRTDTIPADPVLKKFEFIPSRVINNSTRMVDNYITLDKGTKDGVEPEMGVMTLDGVVGKVKAVSKNYATVVSFLHSNYYVSARLQRTGTLCSMYWGGRNPNKADVLYIPKHVQLREGDSIVTSGFNSIYPEGVFLGRVQEFSIREEASFYEAEMNLQTDFSRLSFVYIVKHISREEIDSLEVSTEEFSE